MRVRHIDIEVMRHDNKRVAKRYRVKAPPHLHFTSKGVDEVLENFLTQFDEANPGNKYRLVELGRARFRLVHDPDVEVVMAEAEDDKGTD